MYRTRRDTALPLRACVASSSELFQAHSRDLRGLHVAASAALAFLRPTNVIVMMARKNGLAIALVKQPEKVAGPWMRLLPAGKKKCKPGNFPNS